MQRNINIGRYTLAEIQINDKLLSKIHCVVNYNEEMGWILQDGHQDKLSTNGTWLYLNVETQIIDKMVFKANQTIFQCLFSD
jgi:hypothetical protein